MNIDADHFLGGPGEAEANLRSRIDSEPDWYDYELGYRAAAEAVMDAIEASPDKVDTLVFPLGAICRHAIELALKGLIVMMREHYAEAEKLRHSHNLLGLWGLLRPPLATLGLLNDTGARRVADLLSPFDRLDSSGVAFRYPVGRDGAPSFRQGRLNCRTMLENALAVLAELESIAGSISDDVDTREEAMRDAAYEWWQSLTETEQAEHELAREELYEAYLNGHI